MNEEKSVTVTTQAITTSEFGRTYNDFIKFVKSKLKEGKDYGIIPGTDKKALHKPGAEKIAFLFQLKPKPELVDKVEDWENGFFFYRYRCTLIHFASGKEAGSAERSCNSKEKKYAYNVKAEKWATDEEKRVGQKFTKKNGNFVNAYLRLRKTPEESADQVNTIMAMAQKRAIVAAVVQATMASEIFDADVSPEGDDVAPNEPTTKDEDPRRNQLMMRLWGVAKDHGWTKNWLHTAINKKWQVESLTQISNNQIEELADFIITTYHPVGDGEVPILRSELADEDGVEIKTVETKPAVKNKKDDVATKSISEPVEDEEKNKELEKEKDSFCRNTKKHGEEKKIIPADESFCDKECQDEYWGPNDKISKERRLQEFIERGRKNKKQEEDEEKKND